jgi:hypothetical protein
MDTDPDRAARVYRRNRRIVWCTVGAVVALFTYSVVATVRLFIWWSNHPQLHD